MHKLKFHLIFAICCAAILTLISWLSLFGLSSPALAYLYGFIHIAPFFLAQKISGNENPSQVLGWTLIFGQWFVLGFCASFLFSKSKR